jgi:ParB/RepB/Spo0J family partition protein
MSELVLVKLSEIDSNPHRNKKRFPIGKRRKEALKQSIAAVGLWEGIIGRRVGNRIQIAFGHAREEVCRELGIKEIWMILRELSDEQMLQFMGRENMEEFNADFLVMYEAWEAAVKFCARTRKNTKQIDLARLLGWLAADGKANATARACDSAHQLIRGGHMQLIDLEGLSVSGAQQVVERVLSRIEMIERLGKKGGRPTEEMDTHKRQVADAGRSVAKDYREGKVANREIKPEIDYRAVKEAAKADKPSPLFAPFAKEVAESIHKMLVDDRAAAKLADIEQALPIMTLEEDRLALRRIDFALAEHEETTGKWRKRLAVKGQKVVPFKLLSKEDR